MDRAMAQAYWLTRRLRPAVCGSRASKALASDRINSITASPQTLAYLAHSSGSPVEGVG